MYSKMLEIFKREIISAGKFVPGSSPIVFIGGGGFIGSTMSSLAQDLGFDTLVVDSSPPINSLPVNFIQVDAFDQKAQDMIRSRLLPNSTIVILATPFIVDMANSNNVSSLISDSDFFEKNVSRYYKGIVNFVRNAGVPINQIIYISSFDVYGSHHHSDMSISENIAPKPNSLYSITKLTGEIASSIVAKEIGCRLRILRLSQVIGRGEKTRYHRLIPILLNKFGAGEHVPLKLATDTSRQYVSIYQVFSQLLDSLLNTSSEQCVWNCVGVKTKLETIIDLCRDTVGRGSYSIEYGNLPDLYRARVSGHNPSFFKETFGTDYLHHIKAVIDEEFEFLNESSGQST